MATAQILSSVFSSIVFLKIHDFGRRAVIEQTRLRAQLEVAVAVVLPDLNENARIVLDAADGIMLVVLDDPRTALALAERTLAAGAVGLPLSIGINHGAVKLSGKSKNEGLLGDGIAVAAAIAELAGPQKLLLTRDFRQALEDAAPGAEAALTGAGTHTDASLRAHDLYRTDPGGERRRARRYLAATVAAVVALAGAGVAYRVSIEGLDRYTERVTARAKDAVQWLTHTAPPPAPPAPPAPRTAKRKGR